MKNFLVIIKADRGDYTNGLDTFKVSAPNTADAVQQLEELWAENPDELRALEAAYICPLTEALSLPIGSWKRKYVKPQSS